ncbi:hypothetical protein J2T13_002073 [Paenibacillus sp. DS2015]|uniref:stalk domain-containing protein n=1 Tax=Paenibacillus sp. DS2015 TaxID=3373917 RepID=UPI003D1B3FDF
MQFSSWIYYRWSSERNPENPSTALNHNITFKVDGIKWTPKDSNGDKLSALVYDGSTYVPLRVVSEALGAEVSWNNSSQQITRSIVQTVTLASLTKIVLALLIMDQVTVMVVVLAVVLEVAVRVAQYSHYLPTLL